MSYQRRYKLRDHRFGVRALTLREKAGLIQSEVANALQVSERTIQAWEGGTAYPAGANLQKLIALYLQHGAFAPGHERDEAQALWTLAEESGARRTALFDEAWFEALLAQHQRNAGSPPDGVFAVHPVQTPVPRTHVDWDVAPDTRTFVGRERELATVMEWVHTDQCRVVVLLGMGGIGKTTLAATCARRLVPHFTYVIWRSLRNAPLLEELLADCLPLLAEQQLLTLPESNERRVALMIELLRQRRCLLVLDDVDTLLEAGSLEGRYRSGYEPYRLLFQHVAQIAHHSCLILTSREMLSELDPLTGTQGPVRTIKLPGLEGAVIHQLLYDKDVWGTPELWRAFGEHYAGNPLALKIAAATVRDLFAGDLHAFLHDGPVTLHTLHQLLEHQFNRLTPLERDLLYWLAIERDLVTPNDLSADIPRVIPRSDLLAALRSLLRRSLIERGEQAATFGLQPVVLEFVSGWLVARVADDIIRGASNLLATYALMKAHSNDYIRDSQLRMLVQPVLDRLLAHFGNTQQLEQHLRSLVRQLQAQPSPIHGYAAGNIINLVVCHVGHIRGWDFSRLVVRQAYLQGVEAQDASFAAAEVGDTRLMEPLESIAGITLSPDGQYLAIGSFSGHIRVWQVRDRRLIWTTKGHTRMVWGLAFSSDSTRLASGGYQGRVRVWETASGRALRTLTGHASWVRTVAWSPDGAQLVSASEAGTVRVWDWGNGTCRYVLHGHAGLIWSVAWSPDGALIASGGTDGTIRLWNARTGASLGLLTQQTSGIFRVAFHPDGVLLASSGEDGQVSLWDVPDRRLLKTLQHHSAKSASVAFNPEGTLLASSGSAGVVKLWGMDSAHTQHSVGTLEGYHWFVSAISFGPHGLLASVAYAGHVKLWDAVSGRCLTTIQGHSHIITATAFSPDGTLLAQGDDKGIVRVWELRSGRCRSSVQGHVGPIWTLTFSPDGEVFASAGDGGDVKLWEARNARCLQSFVAHPVIIWVLAFSPDGRLLATGGGDKVIKLWRVVSTGTDEPLDRFHESADQIMTLAFSPDSSQLASGHQNGEIKLWEVASGQLLQTLQHTTSPISALHFYPDGKTLISSTHYGMLTWWDVTRGDQVVSLTVDAAGNWLKAITFSADGAMLATGSDDQTVKLWRVVDSGNGQPAAILSGHPGQVWAVALSADHRMLASSDDTGLTIIWNTQTGTELRRLTFDRPYERMNIAGMNGVNGAQRVALMALGAVEQL